MKKELRLVNSSEFTIIGDLGTIDYLGNNNYVAVLNHSNITHKFTTKELPEWVKKIEAYSDKYQGLITSEFGE